MRPTADREQRERGEREEGKEGDFEPSPLYSHETSLNWSPLSSLDPDIIKFPGANKQGNEGLY